MTLNSQIERHAVAPSLSCRMWLMAKFSKLQRPSKLTTEKGNKMIKFSAATAALALCASTAIAGQPGTMQQSPTPQTPTATAEAAARAVAIAGSSTNIFEGSHVPNNTPNTYSNASGGTTDCQFPGFAFGIGQPGLGLSISVPLGTDADCKHERMAKFRMQNMEMLKTINPAEAQRNIAAANESLCRVSYNMATAMCAPAPVPQAVVYWCDSPAGYYPIVPACGRPWRQVAR